MFCCLFNCCVGLSGVLLFLFLWICLCLGFGFGVCWFCFGCFALVDVLICYLTCRFCLLFELICCLLVG